METKESRLNRVIARGEVSGHSHVIVGDAEVTRNAEGQIKVTVGNGGAVLKHILEKEYVETGKEVWTREHKDIQLKPGTYIKVQQMEYDPLADLIREVLD
jgi:hypothetical protein